MRGDVRPLGIAMIVGSHFVGQDGEMLCLPHPLPRLHSTAATTTTTDQYLGRGKV
jgi:hypothetical protein